MEHGFDANAHTKQYVNAVINYKARGKSVGPEVKADVPRKQDALHVRRRASSRRSGAVSIVSIPEVANAEEHENKLIKDRAIITRQLMQLESKIPQNPLSQIFGFLTPHSIANNLILLASSLRHFFHIISRLIHISNQDPRGADNAVQMYEVDEAEDLSALLRLLPERGPRASKVCTRSILERCRRFGRHLSPGMEPVAWFWTSATQSSIRIARQDVKIRICAWMCWWLLEPLSPGRPRRPEARAPYPLPAAPSPAAAGDFADRREAVFEEGLEFLLGMINPAADATPASADAALAAFQVLLLLVR
jgi:hypothetical protein